MPFIGGSGSALQVSFSSEAAWVIETAPLPGPETQGQHSESTCDLGHEANPPCKVREPHPICLPNSLFTYFLLSPNTEGTPLPVLRLLPWVRKLCLRS